MSNEAHPLWGVGKDLWHFSAEIVLRHHSCVHNVKLTLCHAISLGRALHGLHASNLAYIYDYRYKVSSSLVFPLCRVFSREWQCRDSASPLQISLPSHPYSSASVQDLLVLRTIEGLFLKAPVLNEGVIGLLGFGEAACGYVRPPITCVIINSISSLGITSPPYFYLNKYVYFVIIR